MPIQVEIETEVGEIAGMPPENEPGTFRLCLDQVTVYGCHGWIDQEDFGGRVSVVRYLVGGRTKMDKLDLPVEALQDLLARYDELERDTN